MNKSKKRWAILGTASAGLLLFAGTPNLFFSFLHYRPAPLTSIAQASMFDSDEDDTCSDPAQTRQLMAMVTPGGQQNRAVAVAASTGAAEAPVGGDIAPSRTVWDAYPSLHSVAVDPETNQVMMSDSNRGAIFFYDRAGAGGSSQMTNPKSEIRGPATGMMFVAGIAIDPAEHEVFAVNNDIGDRMEVFPYGVEGNVKPKRVLSVPHGSWGVALNRARDEVAVSIEHMNSVVVFRRQAKSAEAPLRVLRGVDTGLADPHGIVIDAGNNEMIVANHGNWAPLTREEEEAGGQLQGGHFQLPSIAIYSAEANGDAKPKRTIQGAQTQLDWPMGVSLDATHNEIAVANYGNNSIMIFRTNAAGNVAPIRVLRGDRTGILGPMGVAIYRDHSAVVFARNADGNTAPKRVIRNAPVGTPSVGFGNPGAVAFDTKRGEILVPN
jgi:DNA-binding beta-propeller fold protein YncE